MVGLNASACLKFDVLMTRESFSTLPQATQAKPQLIHDLPGELHLEKQVADITSPRHLAAMLPAYCTMPPTQRAVGEQKLKDWVRHVMQWKCSGHVTSVACYDSHHVDPFTPCMQDVQAALVEDYAWSKGWCDAGHTAAAVPSLPVDFSTKIGRNGSHPSTTVLPLYDNTKKKKPSRVGSSKPTVVSSKEINLAFFMTVYKEPALVLRILERLYSPRHYYVIHVDAFYPAVFDELRVSAAAIGPNIRVVSVMQVVYMASSASQLIARVMMFFLKLRQSGAYQWHYLVACTGSDYPLLPLHKMEQVLAARTPHMPSVMNWSPTTWRHAYLQARQSPESSFVRDTVNLMERRGSNSPAYRRATEQFGVPLTCAGQKSYVRLNARTQAPVAGKEGRRGDDSQVRRLFDML
jgi:hypothetical protein